MADDATNKTSASLMAQQAMKLGQSMWQKSKQASASVVAAVVPSTTTHSSNTVTSPTTSTSSATTAIGQAVSPLKSHFTPIKSSSSAAIDNRPWTVQDIGQNSIASLLNDPNTSSLAQKIELSKQAMAAIPRTQLKQVKTKDFEKYLKDIGPIHAKYMDSKKTSLSGDPVLFDRDSLKNLPAASAVRKPVRADPVSTIPAIFFEHDFKLENPRIFDAVTEFANVSSSVPSIGDKAGATTNSVLQEKLSHYLDTVEVHLVAEISVRSLEFFAALANIQSLHQETLQCLTHVRQVRSALTSVSENQAKKGLDVVRRKKRRNNLSILYNAIKTIKDVKKTQPTIQVLLNQGDYVGALDLITETNRVLRESESSAVTSPTSPDTTKKTLTSRHFHLNGVRGLVHLGGQLAEMSKMIASLMENDFINTLMTDINQQLSQGQDSENGWAPWAIKTLNGASIAAENNVFNEMLENDFIDNESLRMAVTPFIMGLLRTDRLAAALQAYRERIMKTIKNVTKQYLPSALPDERENNRDPGEGALAKRFKAMTVDDFYDMLTKVFTALLQLHRRIALYSNIFTSILKDAQKRGVSLEAAKPLTDLTSKLKNADGTSEYVNTVTPLATLAIPQATKYNQLFSDLVEILSSSSDLAHVRCGKLLTLRAEQNAQLNLKDFFKVFEMTWRFINVGELMCQRTCIGLRGVLMSQAKAFINNFHMEKMRDLTGVIDNEKWSQAEVPVDFQLMLNRLMGKETVAATVFPARSTETIADMDMTSALIAGKDEQQRDDEEAMDTNTASSNLTALTMDGVSYVIVTAALIFLKMCNEYILIADQAASLTPEVLNRLVEIFKFFNTRVCGAIVGGGAVQNGTLKSINAKHLALAGQSLGFVMALIPYAKKDIERYLPAKQQALVNDFDRVHQDYKNNQDIVFERIVTIMEERIGMHIKDINKIDWDKEPGADAAKDSEPSEYMKNLVKDTVKLHKIVRKHLSPDAVKGIFANIFPMFQKTLEETFNHIDLFTSHGKNRVLMDVQYYVNILSSLEWINGPGNQLEVVVNNIRIKDKREKLAPPVVAVSQAKILPVSSSTKISAPAPVALVPTTSGETGKKFAAAFGNFGRMMSKTELPTFGLKAAPVPTPTKSPAPVPMSSPAKIATPVPPPVAKQLPIAPSLTTTVSKPTPTVPSPFDPTYVPGSSSSTVHPNQVPKNLIDIEEDSVGAPENQAQLPHSPVTHK